MSSPRRLANALSLSRLVLVGPTCWTILEGKWGLAAFFVFLAILSDVADGRVVNKADAATPSGRLLDHSCDALFVTSGITCLAWVGIVPWALPVLIALSFLQYVLDSRVPAGGALRASWLGRVNGVAYYVLLAGTVGIILVRSWLDLSVLIPVVTYGLIATTTISMVDRIRQAWR